MKYDKRRNKARLLKRIFTALLAVMIIVSMSSISSFACTIFSVELEDGTILACNNEDWMYSIGNSICVQAGDEENYGYVGFYNSSYVQGGMNEYGLFYDGASCAATDVPHDDSIETLGFNLGEVVLSKCKSVKEVEEFFKHYNIPTDFYDHLLFADAEGDAAVFEWMDGELHIVWKGEEEQSLIVTNFWLTDPSQGGYPCIRYQLVNDAFEAEEASLDLCTEILLRTAQDWGSGGTLYSDICDLKEQKVYLYYLSDMERVRELNLTEQLSDMEPGECVEVDFEDLFSGEIGTIDLNSYKNGSTIFDNDDNDNQNSNETVTSDDEQSRERLVNGNQIEIWQIWVIGFIIVLLIIIIVNVINRIKKRK